MLRAFYYSVFYNWHVEKNVFFLHDDVVKNHFSAFGFFTLVWHSLKKYVRGPSQGFLGPNLMVNTNPVPVQSSLVEVVQYPIYCVSGRISRFRCTTQNVIADLESTHDFGSRMILLRQNWYFYIGLRASRYFLQAVTLCRNITFGRQNHIYDTKFCVDFKSAIRFWVVTGIVGYMPKLEFSGGNILMVHYLDLIRQTRHIRTNHWTRKHKLGPPDYIKTFSKKLPDGTKNDFFSRCSKGTFLRVSIDVSFKFALGYSCISWYRMW